MQGLDLLIFFQHQVRNPEALHLMFVAKNKKQQHSFKKYKYTGCPKKFDTIDTIDNDIIIM